MMNKLRSSMSTGGSVKWCIKRSESVPNECAALLVTAEQNTQRPGCGEGEGEGGGSGSQKLLHDEWRLRESGSIECSLRSSRRGTSLSVC